MAVVCAEGREASKRLHVRNRVTEETFLIDTGAEISLLQVDKPSNNLPNSLKLYAANNTRIETYDKWIFYVAAVPYSIIGDLLNHYGLLMDLHCHRLIDCLSQRLKRGLTEF